MDSVYQWHCQDRSGRTLCEYMVDLGSRLTTTLVLWFMYVATFLQSGGETEARKRLSAIYGIIDFVNVPLVFFSARWWRSIHPVVVTSEGIGLDGKMKAAMFVSLAVFSVLYTYLVPLRMKSLALRSKVRQLKADLLN